MGRFASRRFRLRLLWIGGPLALIACVVTIAVEIGNTGHSTATPIDRTKPAWVYHPPPTLQLTPADRKLLLQMSTKFIQTAVARENVDDAWEIAGPELRDGQSRHDWDTGFIAVPPFKASGIAAWDVLYSYPGDVAFDLALIGAHGQRFLSKTFTIEFKRHHSHWLVASWTPRGVASYTALKPSERPAVVPPLKAPLPRWVLIVPVGIFGGMLAALLGWATVSRVRGRRAARRWAQVLGQADSR